MARPLILVADDDPEMLDIAATVAGENGARVVRVDSGAALIQRLTEDGPFDLVITDVAMPWMNGIQVARAARNAGLSMPLIVMTALDDARIDSQIESLGAGTVLLRKPFDLGQLQATIGKLLRA